MDTSHKTVRIESAKEAIAYINDQYWHDSVLYGIWFMRANSADRVFLLLDLLNDWEKWVSTEVEVAFDVCHYVQAQMNWGEKCLSGGEMIQSAEAIDIGSEPDKSRWKWGRMGEFNGDLGVFRMEMASTGSTLEIVFSGITVTQRKETGPHDAPPPRTDWPPEWKSSRS